jgi:predicted nuclease of predicted toxin-antitoxin system
LLFLIDAQLPPSLAEAWRRTGHQAIHVVDIGFLTASDRQIWDEAVARNAVLVTKDRDFPLLRAAWREAASLSPIASPLYGLNPPSAS